MQDAVLIWFSKMTNWPGNRPQYCRRLSLEFAANDTLTSTVAALVLRGHQMGKSQHNKGPAARQTQEMNPHFFIFHLLQLPPLGGRLGISNLLQGSSKQ